MSPQGHRYPYVSPPLYWAARSIIGSLVSVLTSCFDVQGVNHIPATGSFILATNHLSYLDSPLMFAAVPRIMYFLAGEKYASHPVFAPLLRIGGAIFVQRGEIDREALRQARAALDDGFCLALAVEGTRSKTGGLIRGRSGAAYLASRSGVPIVPVVIWGSEQLGPAWRRLRRASASIRFGPAFSLPAGRARPEQLDGYTEDIMTTLASMLPEGYRGVYHDHPMLLGKLAGIRRPGESS